MQMLDVWASQAPLAVTNIDPDLALFTVIVFVLTMLILWRFAWTPIVQGLDRRERSIAEDIERAKLDAEKAQANLQQYEQKLAAAAEEAKALLAEARTEAQNAKDRIISEAKEEAGRERQRAIEDIQAAKDQAVRELAQKSVDSAVNLAGQLVRRELNPEMHAQLIDESLQRFGSQN